MNLVMIILAASLLVRPALAQDFDRTRTVEPPAPALAPVPPPQPPSDGLGLVSYREGLFARRPGEGVDWLDAPLRSRVEEGDRVRTGPKGRAEIEFQSRNVLRLAPATTLRLARLAEEEHEQALKVDLELEQGDIWAELEGLEDEDDFTIRSQVMGAAITGTGLQLSVNEERETVLTVLHGEVRVAADAAALAGGARPISVDSLGALLRAPAPAARPGSPVPVAGPHPVAGPREVSLSEWLVIVKDMQQIRIGADGRVRAAASIASAGDSDWVRWNLARNKNQPGK
jgi:hypothetical protein